MAWHAGCRYDGALGMLTNALPVPAGIAEASSATNTTETAFTYASRNVVLDKTAKAYAIDTTATNKMGADFLRDCFCESTA